MPELTILRTNPILRDFVSHYSLRAVSFGVLRQIHPIYARTDQILEFYLRDRYRIRNVVTGAVTSAPWVVVVGPWDSYKEDLIRTGTLQIFTIHFQPTGFHRLFHIPMHLVASQAIPATQILGNRMSALLDRLQNADAVSELVECADAYLINKLPNAAPFHPVHRAAYLLKHSNGSLAITDLARQSGLSLRQFERQFRQQVGFTPKLYSRIARFECAFARKCRFPEHSWTRVALDAGYSDQAHLIREARVFSNAAPRQLVKPTESYHHVERFAFDQTE